MYYRKTILTTLLLSVFIIASAAPVPEINRATLQWDKQPFAAQTDGIWRIVIAPEEAAKQNVVSAAIDLVPYRGKQLAFSIRVKADNVSKPPQPWNGVKFMLYYIDGENQKRWLHPNNVYGTFDWREISFIAPIPSDANQGTLMLGLQDASGAVEFDLNSLRVETIYNMVNQDYIITYPERVRQMPPLRGVMSPQREMTEADFKTLQKWNVNLVRLQICRFWAKPNTDLDLEDYDRWIDSQLDKIAREIELAKKYGIKVVIDLHSPPGGRYEDLNMRMFFEPKYADHYVLVWQRIAQRFNRNPTVFGFDLINEPFQTRPATVSYWEIQKRAAEAVRAIDPDTTLIVESNEMDSPTAFGYLSPLAMDNVIYQLHMYKPSEFTHQGVHKHYPVGRDYRTDEIADRHWDKEALRQVLAPVREFQQKHHARIYVGEFSAVAWAPGAAEYLRDVISIFEEYQWDWSYHAFREWEGWSLEHEGTDDKSMKPAADTPRKQVLLDGWKNNRSK